jgi:hypothetical protein
MGYEAAIERPISLHPTHINVDNVLPPRIVHGFAELRVAASEHEDASLLTARIGGYRLKDREEVVGFEEPVESGAGRLAEGVSQARAAPRAHLVYRCSLLCQPMLSSQNRITHQ